MGTSRTISVHIVGDASKLEKSFKDAARSSQRFSSQLSGTLGSLRGLGKAGAVGGAIAGIAGLGKVLSSSIAAAKESQVAQTRLKQALAVSGKSYAVHGKEIDATIQKTSRLAGIDDEELSESFSNLVRTTGNVKKGLQGMQLAADIARIRNISLAAATKIVERVHTGQVGSLKRVGVEIDKNTSVTEALEAAQRKFAGSAEAYGKTAAGAQDRFSVALENLQEKIGENILPALTKLTVWATDFLVWAEVNWPKLEKIVAGVMDKVKTAINAIKPVLDGMKTYIEGWVNIVKGIFTGDWALVWDGAKKVVSGALVAIKELLKAFAEVAYKLGLAIGRKILGGVLDGLQGLIRAIGDKLGVPSIGSDLEKIVAERAKSIRAGAGSGGRPLIPRALGGPVAAGVAYRVGERGPETFVPAQAGMIVPAAGRGGGTYISGDIHVHGVQNVRQLITELQRLASGYASQRGGRYGGQNLALG